MIGCAPSPTPTVLPAPTPQVLQDTPTLETPRARVETVTVVSTPRATLTLSANAEQELADIRAAARDAQGGYLFYLDTPARTQNQVLQVAPDQPVGGVIVAGNYGVLEHDFTILCIVDYAQVPCERAGQEKAFRFHLAPRTETRLGLELALKPGVHDVLFLTFYDPANHSTEQSFRQESRFLFSFYRVQVVVGAGTARALLPIAQNFSTKAEFQPGAGLFTISRAKFSDPSQAPWHEETIQAGAPLDFFAAYSNPETVKNTVALMAFLDFDQVPWDSERLTYAAAVEAGARADVPAKISAPNAIGEHELVVVAVDNPFLNLAGQVNAATPRSFFANSSDRVLLKVP